MAADRLARVVSMLASRGNISADVEGDLRGTAREWLNRARDELPVLQEILAMGQWRVAYNTAYDTYRHAAEALDLAAGYRILASPGAHLATFVLASALIGEASDVFGAANANTITSMRHRLEYLDVVRSTEVTEADARWAVHLAERAVAEVNAALS